MKAVTFQGWTGGEYGDFHSREAGRMREMFHADNMVRNRDALMIPRAGLKPLGVTGLPNGTIKAGGFGADGMWVLIGSTVYYFGVTSYTPAATAYTMADSVSDTITYPIQSTGFLSGSYLFVYDGNTYFLDHVAHTCELAPGGDPPPAGRTALVYQDRMLVGGDVNAPGRLYYSEPGDYGNFPSGNFLDLFNLGAITFLAQYRTGLLVGGLSGSFIYITGVIGFSEQVRNVTYAGAPADPDKGVRLDTDEVLYMGFDRPYVSTYNGALHDPFFHLTVAGRNFRLDDGRVPTFKAVKGIGPDDWLFASGLEVAFAQQRAMLHYDKLVTYHTWEEDIATWIWHAGSGRHVLAVDGSGGTPPVFYIWTTELDRPSFFDDADAYVGDGTNSDALTAFLWLPQFFPDDGTEIRVHSVIVDFRKWNTGGSETNHFAVSVRAVNRYGTSDAMVEDYEASAAQTFDEVGSGAAFGGQDQRETFHFETQIGSGFEVHIDDIRGVGIRSVTVLYEPQPVRV